MKKYTIITFLTKKPIPYGLICDINRRLYYKSGCTGVTATKIDKKNHYFFVTDCEEDISDIIEDIKKYPAFVHIDISTTNSCGDLGSYLFK